MKEHIQQLSFSPRGRRALVELKKFMHETGLGLDSANRNAYVALVHEFWKRPMTCAGEIDEVLKQETK